VQGGRGGRDDEPGCGGVGAGEVVEEGERGGGGGGDAQDVGGEEGSKVGLGEEEEEEGGGCEEASHVTRHTSPADLPQRHKLRPGSKRLGPFPW
jgi:hypothetical protein